MKAIFDHNMIKKSFHRKKSTDYSTKALRTVVLRANTIVLDNELLILIIKYLKVNGLDLPITL